MRTVSISARTSLFLSLAAIACETTGSDGSRHDGTSGEEVSSSAATTEDVDSESTTTSGTSESSGGTGGTTEVGSTGDGSETGSTTGEPGTNEGVWYRTCDLEDMFAQPRFSSDVVVPEDLPSRDVFTFSEFRAAVEDTDVRVIYVRGDAFSSTERIDITAALSTDETRYIIGEEGGVAPSLMFDAARNWTLTGLQFSAAASPAIPAGGNRPSSRSSISVVDGENLMFDSLSRTWGGGGESFLVLGNRRGGSVVNVTLQRTRLEWTGGVSEFMGVIYRSWLSDMDESDFWDNGGNVGWDADSEDIVVQDNVMLGMGDGVQIQSETFTSPLVHRHYERNDHRNFTIRGNLFTSGPNRTAENAVDFKASSQTPEMPARVHSNVMYGYTPVEGGGTSASGAALVAHIRNQHIEVYENLIIDSAIGVALKSFESDHVAHDNVFVDVDTILNMDAYTDGQDAVQLMDVLPSARLERNVVLGDTVRIADAGIGSSNRIDGVLVFNDNVVASVSEFGFPDSGTSVVDGSATNPFSGEGNLIHGMAPADGPGFSSQPWMDSAQTLTTRVGPCPDGSTQEFSIPSRESLPSGFEAFFWAL